SLRRKNIKKRVLLVFRSSKRVLQLKNLCPAPRLCYLERETFNEDGLRSLSSPSRECAGRAALPTKDRKCPRAVVDSRSLRFIAAPPQDSFGPGAKVILAESSSADISPALSTTVFRSQWHESADAS